MSEEPSHPAGRDPNYILSQEEFHETIASVVRRQLAGEKVILNEQRHLFRQAESAIGWAAVSLAFWLALVGWYAIRGEWRA